MAQIQQHIEKTQVSMNEDMLKSEEEQQELIKDTEEM